MKSGDTISEIIVRRKSSLKKRIPAALTTQTSTPTTNTTAAPSIGKVKHVPKRLHLDLEIKQETLFLQRGPPTGGFSDEKWVKQENATEAGSGTTEFGSVMTGPSRSSSSAGGSNLLRSMSYSVHHTSSLATAPLPGLKRSVSKIEKKERRMGRMLENTVELELEFGRARSGSMASAWGDGRGARQDVYRDCDYGHENEPRNDVHVINAKHLEKQQQQQQACPLRTSKTPMTAPLLLRSRSNPSLRSAQATLERKDSKRSLFRWVFLFRKAVALLFKCWDADDLFSLFNYDDSLWMCFDMTMPPLYF